MITKADLRALLFDAGIPAALNWPLPDANYETVSTAWAEENWNAWLIARPRPLLVLKDIGGGKKAFRPRWLTESGDCDNLALGVMVHAHVGNALASVKRKTERGGLAFGVLFYTAEKFGNAGHAINWLVDHDKAVRFFEPGDGTFLELTEAERRSAWFGIAA